MSKEIPGAEQEGERHHDGAAADEQHPELTGDRRLACGNR
jgi:hypothetical protein